MRSYEKFKNLITVKILLIPETIGAIRSKIKNS